MTTPKVDVTGKFGATYSQLGRDFEAHAHRISVDGLGGLIEAAGNAARFYRNEKNEDTPDDRIYKIDTEKEIDTVLAKIGSDNRLNPEGFDTAAEDKLNELLDKVPEKHQQWFMETYSQRRNGYFHTVNVNTEENKYNRQLEGFMQHSEELRAQAMNYAKQGNQAGYNETLNKWRENEEYMYSHGFMNIHTKISRLQDFTNNAIVEQQTGYAKQLFGNSDKLQLQIKSIENSSKYTPEQKKSIINSIKGEYSSWQAKNKVGNDELSAQADFGIKAYNDGIEPTDFNAEETMQNLLSKGLVKKAAELQNAVRNKEVTATFAGLNPLQMESTLRDMKKNAKTKEDLSLIKTLESLKDKAENQLANDPLAFALDHNVVDGGAIDFNKPESVASRVQTARVVQQKYGLSYTPLITKNEAIFFSNQIQNMQAPQKAQALANIYTGFGEDAKVIFNALAPKNPEFAQAAALYMNNPNAAINILEGMDIVKNQPEFTPSKTADFDSEYYKKIGTEVFSEMSPEWNEGIKKTIKADLAVQNKETGVTDRSFNSDNFNKAFAETIGEIVDIKMNDTGYLFKDSFKTVTPSGVSATDFENWWRGIDDEKLKDCYTMSGIDVDAQTLDGYGSAHFIGNGRYRVKIRGEYVYKDGIPLILEYGEE